MDKFLTIKDVSEYFQISKEKIYKLAQQGKIPVSKIENQWQFRFNRINAWFKANELETSAVITQPIAALPLVSKAGPFLKWAGGKSRLLRQYDTLFPLEFNNYIEPFVGGGAVFFHLYNTDRLSNGKKAVLIDSNEELINCYLIIKAEVNKLIRALNNPKFKNEKDVYYKIRAEAPKNKFERAARAVYLNKTCFNGLFRYSELLRVDYA